MARRPHRASGRREDGSPRAEAGDTGENARIVPQRREAGAVPRPPDAAEMAEREAGSGQDATLHRQLGMREMRQGDILAPLRAEGQERRAAAMPRLLQRGAAPGRVSGRVPVARSRNALKSSGSASAGTNTPARFQRSKTNQLRISCAYFSSKTNGTSRPLS